MARLRLPAIALVGVAVATSCATPPVEHADLVLRNGTIVTVDDLIPEVDGGFDVPMGMAKSHTFFLCFHDGGSEQQDFRDMAFAVQRWPMPTADRTRSKAA